MSDIREALELMRRALRDRATLPLSSPHQAESVYLPDLVRKEFHNLQKALGIRVLGFVVLDPIDAKPITLFSKAQFFFPFILPDNSRQDLNSDLNTLFSLWRQQESISYPLNRSAGEYPPEYHYYTPTPCQTQYCYEQAELSYRNRYGCHYVPLGEIAFFVLAWRLLLCIASGSFKSIDEFLQKLATVHEEHLNRRRIERSNSCDLRNLVSRLPPTSREWTIFSWLNRQAAPRSKRQISELSECDVGASPAEIFLEDLLLLNQFPEQSTALVAFVASLRRRLSTTAHHQFPDYASMPENLDLIKYIVTSISELLCVGSVHKSFVTANAIDLLSRLHAVSRFPVIPYYYWHVVDSTPKAHLTFPTWFAYSQSYKSLSFDTVAKYCEAVIPSYDPAYGDNVKHPGKPTIFQAASAFAVMGVIPLQSMDWTCGHGPSEGAAQDDTAFEFIREYTMNLFHATYDQALLSESASKRIAASKIHRLKNNAAHTRDFLQKLADSETSVDTTALTPTIKRLERIRLLASHTLYRLKNKGASVEVHLLNDILSSLLDAFVDERYRVDVVERDAIGRIRCDSDILTDILYELIENSLQYAETNILISCMRLTDKEVVEFKGRISPQEGYGTILIEVADQGPGIHLDNKETIFEPAIGKTSSMGLWICRTNLQAMIRQDKELALFRASLWEDGDYGRGARFRFAVAEHREQQGHSRGCNRVLRKGGKQK